MHVEIDSKNIFFCHLVILLFLSFLYLSFFLYIYIY